MVESKNLLTEYHVTPKKIIIRINDHIEVSQKQVEFAMASLRNYKSADPIGILPELNTIQKLMYVL